MAAPKMLPAREEVRATRDARYRMNVEFAITQTRRIVVLVLLATAMTTDPKRACLRSRPRLGRPGRAHRLVCRPALRRCGSNRPLALAVATHRDPLAGRHIGLHVAARPLDFLQTAARTRRPPLLLRTDRSSPRGAGESAPLREQERWPRALYARDSETRLASTTRCRCMDRKRLGERRGDSRERGSDPERRHGDPFSG